MHGQSSPWRACAHCCSPFRPTETSTAARARRRYCSPACANAGRKAENARRFAAHFWERVDTSGHGCWPWTGHIGLNGYGLVWNGEKTEYAHRVAYRLAFGDSPPAVCHRCDNPPCCRPSHLFGGNAAWNNADKWSKGRGVLPMGRGSAINTAKLTADDVRAIRALHAAGGVSHVDLGQRYGVRKQTIRQIVLRLTWRHVE